MRQYILYYKSTVNPRMTCLPSFYGDGRQALGAAVVELDRLMREQGYNGRYTLYPPYRAGDTVNLTAVGDNKGNGYPQQQIAIDIYVQPVIIDEDLTGDWEEENT